MGARVQREGVLGVKESVVVIIVVPEVEPSVEVGIAAVKVEVYRHGLSDCG